MVASASKPANAARLAPGHDLWVVYGRTGQGKMIAPTEYTNSLAALGKPGTELLFGRYVVAWRFNTSDAIANACGDAQSCASPAAGQP